MDPPPDFGFRNSDFQAPLAIVRTVADRQIIVALSPEAAAFGMKPGMTLTQAKALCAHVQHAEHEPLRDRRALEALARWLMRFSPFVAIARQEEDVAWAARPCLSSKPKTMGEPPMPHAIFLDLTGSDRLFGGIENLVRQIRDAFLHLRITARLAIAPTPGAAWALAEAGRDVAEKSEIRNPKSESNPNERMTKCSPDDLDIRNSTFGFHSDFGFRISDFRVPPIVTPEELPAALAPLPPAALRISGDLIAALHHLGLETIGQVCDLPRGVLPTRFGKELLLRLDQAMGRIPEPLVPLEHHAPVEAKMEFEFSISSLETIWIASKHLLQQIVGQLTHRGCGARRLDLELSRAYAPAVKKSITLSHPSRNAKSLFNLVQCALEGIPCRVRLGGRVSSGASAQDASAKADPTITPSGYTALHFRVPLLQRVTDEQIFLLEQEHHTGRLEMDGLIDRLRLRLGERAVVQAELVESHLPEKAWKERVGNGEWGVEGKPEIRIPKSEFRMSEFLTEHSVIRSFGIDSEFGIRISGFPLLPTLHSPLSTGHSAPAFGIRHSDFGFRTFPLHLLPTPVEVRVMVTPSHAAEGRPAAFVHERQMHRVTHWSGPQRIAGCWWEGHNKTRDYFEVENPAGRRFWIFRVCETGKWYLHGSYE